MANAKADLRRTVEHNSTGSDSISAEKNRRLPFTMPARWRRNDKTQEKKGLSRDYSPVFLRLVSYFLQYLCPCHPVIAAAVSTSMAG
jgi:hypothetical protein